MFTLTVNGKLPRQPGKNSKINMDRQKKDLLAARSKVVAGLKRRDTLNFIPPTYILDIFYAEEKYFLIRTLDRSHDVTTQHYRIPLQKLIWLFFNRLDDITTLPELNGRIQQYWTKHAIEMPLVLHTDSWSVGILAILAKTPRPKTLTSSHLRYQALLLFGFDYRRHFKGAPRTFHASANITGETLRLTQTPSLRSDSEIHPLNFKITEVRALAAFVHDRENSLRISKF